MEAVQECMPYKTASKQLSLMTPKRGVLGNKKGFTDEYELEFVYHVNDIEATMYGFTVDDIFKFYL